MSFYEILKEEYLSKQADYKDQCRYHGIRPTHEPSEVLWWQKEIDFCEEMISLGARPPTKVNRQE